VSSLQKQILELLRLELKPDVEKAQQYINLLQEADVNQLLIERLKAFIKQQLHAAELKNQAGDAASLASRTWSEIRSAAEKHDDLVDKAFVAARAKDNEPTQSERARTFLKQNHPLVLNWIEQEPDALSCEELQASSNSGQMVTLLMVGKATIGLCKNNLISEDLQIPLRLVLVEFLERIRAGSEEGVKALFRTAYAGLPARDVIAAVDSEVADCLAGSAALDKCTLDVLWAAILCASYWDNQLASPPRLVDITSRYMELKRPQDLPPPPVETTEKPEDPAEHALSEVTRVLMVVPPGDPEWKKAFNEASVDELSASLDHFVDTAFEDMEEEDITHLLLVSHRMEDLGRELVDDRLIALREAANEARGKVIVGSDGVAKLPAKKAPEAEPLKGEARWRNQGAESFRAGAARESNPYIKKAEKAAWFAGYNEAAAAAQA
jgi:hypothetical protein